MMARPPRPEADVVDASAADVREAVRGAQAALEQLDHPDRSVRAISVEAIAGCIDEDGEAIVSCADAETALGLSRLTGELARTVMQLRFYAASARLGVDLELAVVEGSTDGTIPDLICTTVGIGPVAVVGAGNFPLAFGAFGTDCAAAMPRDVLSW